MRKQRSREEWASIFREQENSGLTAAVFCQREKLHPNMFYRKRKEYGAGRFIKLHVPQNGGSGIRIRIGDVVIEPGNNFDEGELNRIIRTVRDVCDARLQ